ncbi:MAG: VanW family protein [Herpetosiphon sp.]
MKRLLLASQRAERNGDTELARRLLVRATRLYHDSVQVWQQLARLEQGAQQEMCYRWIAHLECLQKAQERPRRDTSSVRRSVAIGVAGLLLVAIEAGSLAGRILPGVSIDHVDVGGLRQGDALRRLQDADEVEAQQVVTIVAGDRIWSVERRHLWLFDQASIKEASTVGREGTAGQRVGQLWRQLSGAGLDLPGHRPDSIVVDQLCRYFARVLDRPAIDARIARQPEGFVIEPEIDGQRVDQVMLREQLTMAGTYRVGPAVLSVPMVRVQPRIVSTALQPVVEQLNSLAARPLTVTINEQHWDLDRRTMLTVQGEQPSMVVDRAAIGQFVSRIKSDVDRPARSGVLEVQDGRVRAFSLPVQGMIVDEARASDALAAAVVRTEERLTVAMEAQSPVAGLAEQLGLVAEVGRGRSQFVTYSSPDRDANVVVGGLDVDGVIIPPGGEFSFTKTVGSITWEKGYRWGQMIEAGQIRPALGGGICQVSTTLFRAALQSGLPITERHSHAWRLPWYESDGPPGLDATIVLGGPDLRFRNDTAGHVLIRVITDLERKEQTVVLYGTPTGRVVEVAPQVGPKVAIERRIRQQDRTVAETFASTYAW